MSATNRLKKHALKCAASILVLSGFALTGAAHAQDADAAEGGEFIEVATERVTITGSRIVRDGFQAPTPLTVMGAEELANSATPNMADFVNTIPAFSGSRAPTGTNSSMSGGTSGMNTLNLRGLGLERTLVLLDGRRTVASRPTGVVDVNTFPQTLVERVEIVTGGASAAYGADAVAGVVNFILDKDFTGIKGEVGGGITTHGDNESWETNLTAGAPFANGRGHVIVTGSASYEDGVSVNDRDWNREGWNILTNPNYNGGVNGQPEYLIRDHVSPSNGIIGGIITSTALSGLAFGEGGTVYPFPYGDIVVDPVMVGGGWQAAAIRGKPYAPGLTSRQETQNIFGRLSYAVTDNINVWAEASWSGNENRNWCCMKEDTNSLTISIENAFIPESVRAQAEALGITSFRMGSMHGDLGRSGAYNDREVQRYTLGADGFFEAFESEWDWNVYYQKGKARAFQETFNVIRRSNFTKALDSVINPATGQPECRVNVDANPGNNDAACVPYNIFGINVNSPATADYIKGSGARDYRIEYMEQDIVAGSISGSPFSTWAGPVSIATGLEYREDKVDGVADPISAMGDWNFGNYRVFAASQSVTEGFVETVVPLAADLSWARYLELNAAVRGTDYETSGFVTTWKVGLSYMPIDDIRFRGTVSRDIRAPTLNDLFSAGGGGFPGIVNPFRGGATELTVSSTVGNPDLRPEESEYLGFGVVVQPSFLPGFTASVDYWDVDISDAIGNASTQQIIDFCFEGRTEFCDALTFGPDNTIELIRSQPFNLTSLSAKGIDIEGQYRFAAEDVFGGMPGNVQLGLQATHLIERLHATSTGAIVEVTGQNRAVGGFDPAPDWRWRATLDYALASARFNLTARGVSSGVYDNTWIECTTTCPASSASARTTENNDIPSAIYFDAAVAYNVKDSVELFFNVQNIADKDPAVVAPGPGGFSYEAAPAEPMLYDTLGRTFRAGIRFQM
jgi:outer membrane receptor protein involved in Fe transport